MIELTIDRSNSHTCCVLGFSNLSGLRNTQIVKRQFKYWSNRAISTCFDKHVLTITMPNDSCGFASSEGVATVGN